MSLASQLTERVTIEQPALADDGYGGKTLNWVELATVFAQVQPILRIERDQLIGDQREANAGYRVTIRYRSDVTAAMRIIWKTHTLMIHSLHETNYTLSILSYEENL